MDHKNVEQAYLVAKEQYAAIGVDTDAAMKKLQSVPVSMHCWQGDDVGGYEHVGGSELSGGIQATGNYPGKARTIDELRADIEKALSLIPGNHRLNLHACYLDNGGTFVDRDQIEPKHFKSWIDWGKGKLDGMDFNPTYFSHEKAADGFTLSHPDNGIRDFWVEHGIACRKIGTEMGKQFGSTTVTNVWIPDSYKDTPADRVAPRMRLTDSLDKIFAELIDPKLHLDAVESKLFGIGGESYTVGSHEYYMGYAVSRQKVLCLDAGHFHPTEMISDKISSVMMFCPELLCMSAVRSVGTVTMWFALMMNFNRLLKNWSAATSLTRFILVWTFLMPVSIALPLGLLGHVIWLKHCFLPCLNRSMCFEPQS